MRAFDLNGVASFPRIPSVITLWDLILYDCAVIDVKFRIVSFDKNEPSSSVLVFSMYFYYQHKKQKQNFTFSNGTSNSITDVAKVLLDFLIWKVFNRLKSNLWKFSFSLWKERFCLKWICLLTRFYTRQDFHYVWDR